MLSIALLATLVGFALLVVALVMSKLAVAIACVAVCAVGLVLLLIDTIRANRRGHAGVEAEPLFTIRGRESATREEPLDEGSDDGAGGASTGTEPEYENREYENPEYGDSGAPTGLGSLVAPEADRVHADGLEKPDTLSGGFAVPDENDQQREGDANDYIRSVTGSFPAQTPPAAGSGPFTAPAWSVPGGEPVEPATPATGFAVSEPQAHQSQAPQPQRPEPQRPEPQTPEPQAPQPEPYVGRRRLDDSIVVQESDSQLPAMKFVYDHSESDRADDRGHDRRDGPDQGDRAP